MSNKIVKHISSDVFKNLTKSTSHTEKTKPKHGKLDFIEINCLSKNTIGNHSEIPLLCTPIEMAEKNPIPNAAEDVEQTDSPHMAGRNAKWSGHFEKSPGSCLSS